MEHEVHVIDRPALQVASRRRSVTLETIGPTLSAAFGEAYAAIEADKATPNGAPFVIYHSMPTAGRPLDIQICAPVVGAFRLPSGWHVEDLPGGTFASRTHVGPYDTIGATYEALSAWISVHGFAIAGPPREVYASPPDTPPDQIHTIVEFPLLRVAAAVR